MYIVYKTLDIAEDFCLQNIIHFILYTVSLLKGDTRTGH